MTKGKRITLIIEGVPEEEGRIRLRTLLTELQSLNAALSRISRDTAEAVESAPLFNIEELSYNSPMQVVIGPSPGHEHIASHVIDCFEEVTGAVTTGKSLEKFDTDLLKDIKNLAKPIGLYLKSTTLLFKDAEFDLVPDVTRRIDAALEVAEECIGFLEGRLEKINIHEGANTFHIYPEVGPKRVTCHFPPELLDDAIFAVNRKVEVSGTLKYRRAAAFPHEIAVTAIEAFPPEDELPTWEDLRGRAPNATGGLSSEAFVRELRNGWR